MTGQGGPALLASSAATTRMAPARLSIAGALATVLASLSLTPLFEHSPPWFTRFAFVLAICVGTGMLVRRLSGRRLAAVAAQAAVTAYTLLAMSNSQTFWHGLLPTSDTLVVLGHQLQRASAYSASYAAPVETQADLTMMIVLLLTTAGFVVDVLVSTLRLAAWSGLVLLGMYTVPTALQAGSVSVLAFGLAALGYVLLLAIDGSFRIRGFGRAVGLGIHDTDEPGEGEQTEARIPLLGSTGRRIGFAAVALAVVVPLLLPELTPRGSTGDDGDGTGPGTRMIQVADPTVSLNRDLRRGRNVDLFSYTVDARIAGEEAKPDYLRMVVLDEFTGAGWRASARAVPSRNSLQGRTALPVAPGLLTYPTRGGETYRFTMTDEFQSTWLPLAYPAQSVTVAGDWRYDERTYDVVAAGSGLSTRGISYSEQVPAITLSAAKLNGASSPPASVAATYTDVGPVSLPTDFVALTNRIAARAGGSASNYAKAVAIQDWFRSEFAYSLDVAPETGTDALMAFLQDRTGYCQQFSATMALMARVLGIPARVAVGFTPGEQQADGSWVVRSHDAHAWPELYFGGSGWVRFEPTPSVRTGSVPAWADPTPSDLTEDGAAEATATATAAPQQDEIDRATTAPIAGDTVDLGTTRPWWQVPALLTGLGVVLALALGPGLIRTVQRRRRLGGHRLSAAVAGEQAWAEVLAACTDLGIEVPADRTVRQTTVALRRNAAGAEEDLAHLASLVEAARYSPRSPQVRPEVAGQWARRVLASLVAPLTLGQRIRARMIPASLLLRRSRRER